VAAPRLSRKQKQEQTRTAILRAAATLFAEHGVEGTSMEAIARHAGLTQGAIYSNFESKSDLWWAVVDDMSTTLEFAELLAEHDTLDAQLDAIGRAAWRLLNAASRTDLLIVPEFDLFLMRNPKERGRYAREFRAELATVAQLLHTEDGERVARRVDIVLKGLVQTFMLDPRALDEQLCVDTARSVGSI
jgi:AcrR family transcriptional regulator